MRALIESVAAECDNFFAVPDYVTKFIETTKVPDGCSLKPWTVMDVVCLKDVNDETILRMPYETIRAGIAEKLMKSHIESIMKQELFQKRMDSWEDMASKQLFGGRKHYEELQRNQDR